MTLLPLQLVVATFLAAPGESESVVLDFTAKWCQPCQRMSPLISKLERDGVPIRRIDVDQHRDYAERLNVKNLPTFVLIIDGQEVDRFWGADENKLRALCARIPQRQPRANEPADRTGDSRAETLPQEPKAPAPKRLLGIFGRKTPEPAANKPAVARTQNDDRSPPTATTAGPLQASVRIRVKDAQGENYGSGTIIDSRDGQALVLTCGHIFRHLDQSGSIEVDVFDGDRHKTFVGKKLKHDLDADVGLVRIAADPLPVCRVAPPGMRIQKGTPVETVGCSGGNPPTVQRQAVTAINRYMGPDNIECNVVPVQGRSGGGLFARDGRLIGVCMAADPNHREGLYAGVKTIHDFLDGCRLTHLYRPTAGDQNWQDAQPRDATVVARSEQIPVEADAKIAGAVAAAERRPQAPIETSQHVSRDDLPEVTGSEVTPEELLGSEIVVIIRPRGGQKSHSKVVMVNRASRRFVEYLTGELDSQDSLLETTLAKSTRSAPGAPQQVRRPIGERAVSLDRPRQSSATATEAEAYRRTKTR